MKAMRLRRGTSAERLLITPQEGELIYTTDTKTVYVGDGVTLGGVNFDSGAITVSDINDITIDNLLNDHILVWNSSNSQWENQPRSVSLNNLNDVVYSDPPIDGLPLIYDNTLFQWRPGTSEDGSLIRDLSDVSDVSYGSGPTDGQRLVWNNSASRWESTNLYDQSLNTANTVSFAEVRGNFVGSVFADDSTPIVDAINAAVTGKVQLTGSAPSSNTATGSVGEIRFDENYVYVCTATNTWKRVAMENESLVSSIGTFAVNVNYPSTLVNTPYSDNVLNNDEGDTLSISSWGTPTNGTLTSTNSNGSFTYTPNTDFIGNDSFSYELTDGTLTSTGLVFIVVADVDDERPTVVSSTPNQTYTVGVEITPLDLSAAYSDDTGIELVTVVFNPLPNGLTINTSTGVVTGTPSVGSEGTYNMRIWAYNINGLWTEDNFTITVNAA